MIVPGYYGFTLDVRVSARPSVRPSTLIQYLSRWSTWVNTGFSPNLPCGLILWRSGLGWLMSKCLAQMLKVSYCDWSMYVVRLASSVLWRQQFALKAYSYTPGSTDLKLRASIDKKMLKSFQSEIQDDGRLEDLFFATPPEPKSQLTWNLVGSIGVACR